MRPAESYWDIVWRQFRANTFARLSLWALAPLIGLAVCAPLLCSNEPFVFDEGSQRLFPWFRALFHPSEPVDLLFNMALIAFAPWLLVVAGQLSRWRRLGFSAGRGLWLAGLQFVGLTLLAFGLVSIPGFRPDNPYAARTFTEEESASQGVKHGTYAPIPFSPTEQDLGAAFQPPMYRKPPSEARDSNDSFPHLLGTDNTGRDILARMVFGTRISITVGLVAVGIYLLIGCVIGALAGYFGGAVDMVISRVVEVVLLFPSFFLILTLVGLIGPSIYIIMGIIGITGWPSIARLIRGEVLKQRSADYVSAAQALAFTHARIIFRHVLPNSLAPALVAAPFGIAGAIITEAGLSLLGFGVRPPTPSWGSVLRLGSENYAYWWLVLIPSVAIFFTVTVFNLIGSGLRDAMDPRLRDAGK
ncbi:MAG: ABC transporter permease [Planctomycetaceae bacterium]